MNNSRFIILMKSIWPKVYRVTNGVFYWILNFIKNLISRMINQAKYG